MNAPDADPGHLERVRIRSRYDGWANFGTWAVVQWLADTAEEGHQILWDDFHRGLRHPEDEYDGDEKTSLIDRCGHGEESPEALMDFVYGLLEGVDWKTIVKSHRLSAPARRAYERRHVSVSENGSRVHGVLCGGCNEAERDEAEVCPCCTRTPAAEVCPCCTTAA